MQEKSSACSLVSYLASYIFTWIAPTQCACAAPCRSVEASLFQTRSNARKRTRDPSSTVKPKTRTRFNDFVMNDDADGAEDVLYHTNAEDTWIRSTRRLSRPRR